MKPALYLPHPARVKLDEMLNTIYMNNDPFGLNILDLFGDPSKTINQSYNEARVNSPTFNEFVNMSANSPDNVGTNHGQMDSLIYPARYFSTGEKMFSVSSNLCDHLDATDVGGNLPCELFKAPFDSCYIEFGDRDTQTKKLSLQNGEEHIVEGVYLNETLVLRSDPTVNQTLVVDNNRDSVRSIQMCFTGSPIGFSGNVMDDCTRSFVLYISDDEESISDVLERHFGKYEDKNSFIDDDYVPLVEKEKVEIRVVIEMLIKSLLYINSAGAQLERINEKSEMLRKVADAKGNGKKKKLQKRLGRLYDRILVGGGVAPVESRHRDGFNQQTHYRRGHWRSQRFGKGNEKIKAIWIKPTVVNAIGDEAIKSKSYIVK